MSSPISLSQGSVTALQHVRQTREINTVILRRGDEPGVLSLETEGNLTHDELVAALPVDEPRLVVHALAFASPDGTRRHEYLLILWHPPHTISSQEPYVAGYEALKEILTDVRVHLTARQAQQLAYPRLVALANAG